MSVKDEGVPAPVETVEITIRKFHATNEGLNVAPSASILIDRAKLDKEKSGIRAALCELLVMLDKTLADLPSLGECRVMTRSEVDEYRADEAKE